MSTSFVHYLWVALMCSAIRYEVAAYSGGAPTTSCVSMEPEHGGAPSNDQCPFETLLNQVEVFSNDTLTLTLRSKPSAANSFKGFLIMGFDVATESIVGTFKTTSSQEQSQTIECYETYDTAATHKSSSSKTSVSIEWIPPEDYEGTIVFKTTYVETSSKYWVKELSQEVKISRFQDNTTATTEQPTATSQKPVIPDIYEGCGNPGTKGCSATPSGCIKSKNCLMMTTYKKVDDHLELEIYGQASGDEYIAVGFSSDKEMGIDSVVECAHYRDTLGAYQSFNTEGKGNLRLESHLPGFALKSSALSDGNIYCKVQHPINYTINFTTGGPTFDLRKPYFLLMAGGPSGSGNIGRHTVEESGSSCVILTDDLDIMYLKEASRVLKQLYGSFMVIAWLMAASIGILMPRYMKKTWVGKQIMKKDRWFIFHQGLMCLAWVLTMAAFIIIFIDVGGWVSEPVSEMPHALIGTITTVLAFIQPFMAALRPLPSSPNRYIFNLAHSWVGYAAHILAITCIFLAVDMEEAELPYETYWILTAYACVYLVTQLFLTFLAGRNQSAGAKDHTTSKDETGSSVRKVILAVYVCAVVGLGSAVIAFIAGA